MSRSRPEAGELLGSGSFVCAGRRAFSLIELLTVLAVVGVLAALLLPAVARARSAALSAQSRSNLRQLALANLTYASDHAGRLAPAHDDQNLVRWHGARTSLAAPFDPTRGYLSPYLGRSRTIAACPVLERLLGSRSAFNESGAGGYGYNAAYLGRAAGGAAAGMRLEAIRSPSRTVMFTDTALAVRGGLQEYPFTEPFRSVEVAGLGATLQPSTHFRHSGRAHVAWADGSVTSASRAPNPGRNFYGGDNSAAGVGWFGPEDNNGFWNPGR